MMKSNEKKGQVQISFNWIFVLIAGAVILFFFITVITREQSSSEQQISDRVSARLETIFSVLQENPDSIAQNDELTFELDFYCDEEGHYYKLKSSSAKAYLETETIFAPRTIGASRLITWSSTYSTPYPATPVLMLSDEKTLYIFVQGNTNRIQTLYNDFPDLFEKKLISDDEIVDSEGYRSFIIITEGTQFMPNYNSANFLNKVQQVVVVQPRSELYGDGKIIFYSFFGGSLQLITPDMPYFSKELLFGAIVSGDNKLYGCTLDKVMQKARITGRTNIERASSLNDLYPNSHRCKIFYSSLISAEIQNVILHSTFKPYNVQALQSSAESLKRYNDEIRRQSCVLIY